LLLFLRPPLNDTNPAAAKISVQKSVLQGFIIIQVCGPVARIVEAEGGPQAFQQNDRRGGVAIQLIQAQLAQGRDKRLQAAARLIVGCEILVLAQIGPVFGEHAGPLGVGRSSPPTGVSAGVD